MISPTLNENCEQHIWSFCNIVDLSRMMMVSKENNLISMKVIGNTYKNQKATKLAELKSRGKGKKRGKFTHLMHLGRLISTRNQEIAKKCLLPGVKHSEAVLSMTCMLCNKKCRSVSVYGFVAHFYCIRKKEKDVAGKSTGIPYHDVPYLHGLRKRELYTGGLTRYAIENGIPGVYPYELSLRGYMENNKVEIAQARETVSTMERIRVEEEEKLERTTKERQNRVKAEIETIIGKPFEEWVSDHKKETSYSVMAEKFGTDSEGQEKEEFHNLARFYSSFFGRFALQFSTGKDSVKMFTYIKERPCLHSRVSQILYHDIDKGETIDMGVVAYHLQDLD